MMIKHCWYKSYDEWSKTTYVVAPMTGHLLVSEAKDEVVGELLALKMLGFTQSSFAQGESSFPLDSIDIDEFNGNTSQYERVANLISQVVKLTNRVLPLKFAIAALEVIFGKVYKKPSLGLNESIGLACVLFGRRSKNDCLELSLKRFALLRHLGHKPTVNIGIFIPTEEMHAWVSVDNVPILECPDILMHYTKALSYSPWS